MNPAEVINTTLLPLLWENNLLLNESKSLEIQEEEVVDETTTATTSIILVLSSLAFVLSPLTVASNFLVIVPFCRLTRVRTPSNQILLALAIIDGLLGFLLFLSSISGISRLTRLLEPQIHVRLSYSLALTMASMQATSLLLMVANSVDKALSIAKPLNYSELVTYKTINIFVAFCCCLGFTVGIVLPLTLCDLDNKITSLISTIPFGPPPHQSLQLGLLLGLTLPCGFTVMSCHLYVYIVASRHAKAIKRDNSVNDRMRTSVSYKMTTTSEEMARKFKLQRKSTDNINADGVDDGLNGEKSPKMNENTTTFLTIPQPNKNSLRVRPLKNIDNIPTPHLNNNASKNIITSNNTSSNTRGRSSQTTASSASSRYGASLALGVLVIFFSRIPSQITSFILPSLTSIGGQLRLLIYVSSNIPLCLCSTLNPWIYAYRNLELKPVMRRMLKKLCRGIQRRSSASSEIEAGLNRSTQWQVSQFASIPRRSSCYRPSEFNQQSPNSPTPEVVVTSGWTPKSLRAKSCPRNPRGRSLGSIVKTKRSKSCVNQLTVPTVTVWDGDANKISKAEAEEIV